MESYAPFPGLWGEPTSTVDWCEANYEHTRYIAEFFNTLSSVSIVAAGVLGLYLHHRLLEQRFLLCFASVALVGLGSVAFHGTLRFELQLLDELPMLYSAIIMVYILLQNKPERRFGRWLPTLLLLHALLVTSLSAFTRGSLQFYLFHLSFGSLEFASLYGVYRVQRTRNDRRLSRLFRGGMAAYAVALALWFLDLKFCQVLSVELPRLGLPNPQLHAFWHVLVSYGFYCLLLVVAYDRLGWLGRTPRLEHLLGFIPYLGNSGPSATADRAAHTHPSDS
jgi:dihydroceramidase